MEKMLHLPWSMLTNDGMYSNTEAFIILIISFVATILFMKYLFRQAEIELRANIISDLGYNGYLQHKAEMEKFGYQVP